jgi:hypothetical protein
MEPCEAVKLLLTRMDSNPQEFSLSKNSKWGDVLQQMYQRRFSDSAHILVMLADWECKMVWEKYISIGKDMLHQEFIKRILDVDKQKE